MESGIADSEHREVEPAWAAAVRSVVRRKRLQSALNASVLGAALAAAAAAPLLAVLKTASSPPSWVRWMLLWLVTAPVFAACAGALRRVRAIQAAAQLDEAHAARGLFTSALEFRGKPAQARSAFETATIEHARQQSPAPSSAIAAPIHRPRLSGPTLALCLGLGVLAMFEVPRREVAQSPPPLRPRLLHKEDLDAEREALRSTVTDADDADPAIREINQELNELLEAIARRELEHHEALSALDGIEARLQELADQDPVDEALRELEQAMSGQGALKPLAQALREGNAQSTAAALEALGAQLQAGNLKPAERKALSVNLARASKPPQDSSLKREKELQATRRRLLEKHRNNREPLSATDQRLLRKTKRQLEQLRRKGSAAAARRRTLERLRRKMANAAGAIGDNSGKPGEGQGQEQLPGQAMKQAAEAARQMARRQSRATQGMRLSERVGSLRELMRQQSTRRSGGAQPGTPGQPAGEPGDPTQAKQGRMMTLSEFGKAARGERDAKTRPGLLSPGKRPQKQGPGSGSQLLSPGQAGGLPVETDVTSGAGSGGKPEHQKNATHIKSERRDSAIRGKQGKGPSRSEVILEAASQGFSSRDYEQVHERYRKHAESTLERDKIPGGYRFYVRRYFQLIRGREEQHD